MNSFTFVVASRQFASVHGREILKPRNTADRPYPALLRWHNEHVYERGAA